MASWVARRKKYVFAPNYHCLGGTSYNNKTMDLLQEDRYHIITVNLCSMIFAAYFGVLASKLYKAFAILAGGGCKWMAEEGG